MTKKQKAHLDQLMVSTNRLGLSRDDTFALCRIERTLHRWVESECGDGTNWAIERDSMTNRPYCRYHGPGRATRYPIADREAGAIRRTDSILSRHPGLSWFYQRDPRGCSVYVVRVEDIPAGQTVGDNYTRGVAVFSI